MARNQGKWTTDMPLQHSCFLATTLWLHRLRWGEEAFFLECHFIKACFVTFLACLLSIRISSGYTWHRRLVSIKHNTIILFILVEYVHYKCFRHLCFRHIFVLFEKQAFNGLLKVIGIQIEFPHFLYQNFKRYIWIRIKTERTFSYLTNISIKTRTKVVHKNVSQGCKDVKTEFLSLC